MDLKITYSLNCFKNYNVRQESAPKHSIWEIVPVIKLGTSQFKKIIAYNWVMTRFKISIVLL